MEDAIFQLGSLEVRKGEKNISGDQGGEKRSREMEGHSKEARVFKRERARRLHVRIHPESHKNGENSSSVSPGHWSSKLVLKLLRKRGQKGSTAAIIQKTGEREEWKQNFG